MENLIVRAAVGGDASRLAELAGQLGYPCTEDEVRTRMSSYLGSEVRTILVAELGQRVVGWASLDVVGHFYVASCVEISGFVVDEEYRSRGIGRQVMAAAEAWTRSRGQDLLRLRTNSLRRDAHRFYEGLGFAKTKEQFVYIKTMAL